MNEHERDSVKRLSTPDASAHLVPVITPPEPSPAPPVINVSGIEVAWHLPQGVCTFANIPVALMWVDTTLAGLMAGVQGMVGTDRFVLALQSQGRSSVASDWEVISTHADFQRGFQAIASLAAVAAWGRWELVDLDEEQQKAVFRAYDTWEGGYQKALGVCWGSAMLAGKFAGYCTRLFGVNCWAEQTTFIARGDACDTFEVRPSDRSIEDEVERLLASDQATRADMAVALERLRHEMEQRQKAEEERRRIEAQMLNSQKLESLGILAGGIAHDFNNLLAAILGNASLALKRVPADSEAHRHLHQIEVAATRAAGLTRQMLVYSGRGQRTTEAVNVSALVEEIAHLLQVTISKKVTLSYRLAPDPPPVHGDGAQLRQVAMNLITNASEAIGDQVGVITIATGSMTADRAYLDATYLGRELPEGEYVFLEVSDSGSGMSPETVARIFDPFFTTKFTGRGLGLAALLGIVRSHKGTLEVDTALGKGSSFRILLPRHAGPSAVASEPSVVVPQARAGTTVLVVDDEEQVRQVAEDTLRDGGYQVLSARDGREALELFEQRADEISLVLLDMMMPIMGGEEVAAEILRRRPAARIVLTSGFTDSKAAETYAGRGVYGFVAKPYAPDTLLATVHAALEPPPAGDPRS